MTDYAYQNAYVTLNEVITQKQLTDVTNIDNPTATATAVINALDTDIREQLTRFIYEASDRLRNEWQMAFVPFDATYTVRPSSSAWSSGWIRNLDTGDLIFDTLRLPYADVLTLDSVTLDGTSIAGSAYYIDDSEGYPCNRIVFDDSVVTLPTGTSFTTSLVIAGTFGYHNNPNRMWLDSGDTVQDAPLTANATTLNVSDGTNFEVLQYLKIEDEYLLITAISTNALTVERGVNGSTATSHVATTAISTYNQSDAVRKEVRRMVIRMFLLRNGFEFVTGGDRATEITEGEYNLPIAQRYFLGRV